MATNTNTTTGAARRAPRTPAAGPAATGAAAPAKRGKAAAVKAAAATVAACEAAATAAGIRAPRTALAAAIATAAAANLPRPVKVPTAGARFTALAAATAGGYVVLPTESADAARERGRIIKARKAAAVAAGKPEPTDAEVAPTDAEVAAAVGAWVFGGGHKTCAAYVTRWLAPEVPAVATWWDSVTTTPVPAGVLPDLPDGGYIAYRRA